MNKLTCLIVDDEPLALDLIERYVRQTPFLELAGKCANAFEAMEKLHETPVQLIFLDIQMPGLNGLAFSRTLSKEQRVIFTTAFEKYALDGYKVEALDFLLKPFNYEEFLKAANKAREWFELVSRSQEAAPVADYIFVRSAYKQVKVLLKDIVCIEGVKDYVKIWLDKEPVPIMSLMSLKSFEEEILPPAAFMRVHRSYIIALDKIQFVERSQVIINDLRITIGEPYKEQFQNYLSGKTL